MTHAELIADLTDLFDVAISDSLDIDWRTIDGARQCVAALLSAHPFLDYA